MFKRQVLAAEKHSSGSGPCQDFLADLFSECRVSTLLICLADSLFTKHVFTLVYLFSPLCYLFANQSTLDCMQVLSDPLSQIIYLSISKPSQVPVDRTTQPPSTLIKIVQVDRT